MQIWIQRADISVAVEQPINSPEEAMEKFLAFDWETQWSSFDALIKRDADCCPPGLGLVREDRNILHICPKSEGLMTVFWHKPQPRRLFGFRKRHSPSNPAQLNSVKTRHIVEMFFSRNDLALAQILEVSSHE